MSFCHIDEIGHKLHMQFIFICRELGIGIVPYSPLGSGFFAGRASVKALPEGSPLV